MPELIGERSASMRMISYRGWESEMQAEYSVIRRLVNGRRHADIVVVNSARAGLKGTLLWSADKGRDDLLNIILTRELRGYRADRVRFFVLIDMPGDFWIRGLQLPIEPSTWWSASCRTSARGRRRTNFEKRRHLSALELRALCLEAGYQRDDALPRWLDNLFLNGPTSALVADNEES